MRISRRWLTVIAAAGGLLIASSPAIAAEAAPAATPQVLTGAGLEAVPAAAQVSAPYNICLTNSTHYCLVSNGSGQQVTISNNPANWSTFRTVHTGGPNNSFQIENGNGNCLRAGTSNVVKIENGACVSSDLADSWSTTDLGAELESTNYGDLMLVHGNVNGWNVWHANPVSGDWTKWKGFMF